MTDFGARPPSPVPLPVVRPTLPDALARRLDALAVRAHLFHRFAHHPLCAAYAPEVIALGRRVRLCRGCVMAGVGAGAGLMVGALLRAHTPAALLLQSLGLAGLFVACHLRAREHKGLTRLLPTALWATGAVWSVKSIWQASWQPSALWPVLIAQITLLSASIFVLKQYRRRTPSRPACATCPERQHAVCSGFVSIVRRERAVQRMSSRLARDVENFM